MFCCLCSDATGCFGNKSSKQKKQEKKQEKSGTMNPPVMPYVP